MEICVAFTGQVLLIQAIFHREPINVAVVESACEEIRLSQDVDPGMAIGIERRFQVIVAAVVISKIAMPVWFVSQEGIRLMHQEPYLAAVIDTAVIILEYAEAV